MSRLNRPEVNSQAGIIDGFNGIATAILDKLLTQAIASNDGQTGEKAKKLQDSILAYRREIMSPTVPVINQENKAYIAAIHQLKHPEIKNLKNYLDNYFLNFIIFLIHQYGYQEGLDLWNGHVEGLSQTSTLLEGVHLSVLRSAAPAVSYTLDHRGELSNIQVAQGAVSAVVVERVNGQSKVNDTGVVDEAVRTELFDIAAEFLKMKEKIIHRKIMVDQEKVDLDSQHFKGEKAVVVVPENLQHLLEGNDPDPGQKDFSHLYEATLEDYKENPQLVEDLALYALIDFDKARSLKDKLNEMQKAKKELGNKIGKVNQSIQKNHTEREDKVHLGEIKRDLSALSKKVEKEATIADAKTAIVEFFKIAKEQLGERKEDSPTALSQYQSYKNASHINLSDSLISHPELNSPQTKGSLIKLRNELKFNDGSVTLENLLSQADDNSNDDLMDLFFKLALTEEDSSLFSRDRPYGEAYKVLFNQKLDAIYAEFFEIVSRPRDISSSMNQGKLGNDLSAMEEILENLNNLLKNIDQVYCREDGLGIRKSEKFGLVIEEAKDRVRLMGGVVDALRGQVAVLTPEVEEKSIPETLNKDSLSEKIQNRFDKFSKVVHLLHQSMGETFHQDVEAETKGSILEHFENLIDQAESDGAKLADISSQFELTKDLASRYTSLVSDIETIKDDLVSLTLSPELKQKMGRDLLAIQKLVLTGLRGYDPRTSSMKDDIEKVRFEIIKHYMGIIKDRLSDNKKMIAVKQSHLTEILESKLENPKLLDRSNEMQRILALESEALKDLERTVNRIEKYSLGGTKSALEEVLKLSDTVHQQNKLLEMKKTTFEKYFEEDYFKSCYEELNAEQKDKHDDSVRFIKHGIRALFGDGGPFADCRQKLPITIYKTVKMCLDKDNHHFLMHPYILINPRPAPKTERDREAMVVSSERCRHLMKMIREYSVSALQKNGDRWIKPEYFASVMHFIVQGDPEMLQKFSDIYGQPLKQSASEQFFELFNDTLSAFIVPDGRHLDDGRVKEFKKSKFSDYFLINDDGIHPKKITQEARKDQSFGKLMLDLLKQHGQAPSKRGDLGNCIYRILNPISDYAPIRNKADKVSRLRSDLSEKYHKPFISNLRVVNKIRDIFSLQNDAINKILLPLFKEIFPGCKGSDLATCQGMLDTHLARLHLLDLREGKELTNVQSTAGDIITLIKKDSMLNSLMTKLFKAPAWNAYLLSQSQEEGQFLKDQIVSVWQNPAPTPKKWSWSRAASGRDAVLSPAQEDKGLQQMAVMPEAKREAVLQEHEDKVLDRHAAVQKIEKDTVGVLELMTTMRELVDEQQAEFDQVTQNLGNSLTNVSGGLRELMGAAAKKGEKILVLDPKPSRPKSPGMFSIFSASRGGAHGDAVSPKSRLTMAFGAIMGAIYHLPDVLLLIF